MRVGNIVHYYPNERDKAALTNALKIGEPIAAIVVRVWQPEKFNGTVNLRLIQDSSEPGAWRTSVQAEGVAPEGNSYYKLLD